MKYKSNSQKRQDNCTCSIITFQRKAKKSSTPQTFVLQNHMLRLKSLAFTLLDTEPPTCGFCPTDISILNATELNVRVNWKRPNCSDNSGNPPSISSNRQSGDQFAVPGSYEVAYTVSDGTNTNKNCSFRITLKSEYHEMSPRKLFALFRPGRGRARIRSHGL